MVGTMGRVALATVMAASALAGCGPEPDASEPGLEIEVGLDGLDGRPGAIRLAQPPGRDFWAGLAAQHGQVPPARIRIGPGEFRLDAPIVLPSGSVLQGAGPGATRIVARRRMAAMIENFDPEGGDTDIAVTGLTADCAARARSGLTLVRVQRLAVRDLTATGCVEQGARISGRGRITRGAALDNVTVHDNRGDGLVVMWAMRNVRYTNIFAQSNGGRGVVIDHSEALAWNISANANGGDGIHLRNLFAASLTSLSATRNGGHGIFVEGLVASTGAAWAAMGNGGAARGEHDEIHFSGGGELSYGLSRRSSIAGVYAGAYADGTGGPSARHGAWFAPSISEIMMSAAVWGDTLEASCAGAPCLDPAATATAAELAPSPTPG